MKMPNRKLHMLYLVLALIFTVPALSTLPSCGGGGGGTTTSAPTASETPNVYMTITPASGSEAESPVNVTAKVYCSTASNSAVTVQIASWGDGSPASESVACSTDANNPTTFGHIYRVDVRNIFNIRADARLSTNKSSSAGASITVNPTTTAPNSNTPTQNSFNCLPTTTTEGQTVACYGPVTCPSGTCSCITDYGDGTTPVTYPNCNAQTNTHSYTNIASNDVTFTVTSYPTTTVGGVEYKGNALTTSVRVRKGAVNAPPAPKLSGDYPSTTVGTDINYQKLTKIINTTTYSIGGTVGTTCDTMYVKTQAGDERQVSSLNKSSSTWSDTTTTVQGWYTRDYYCKNAAGDEGTHLKIDIKGDMVLPEVPSIDPVTSPTTVSEQRITGLKQVSAKVYSSNGTLIVDSSNDERDDLYESWFATVTFTTAGTYSYTYYAKDAAGNQSGNVTVQIQYNTTGGGSGGGGGTTNPGAPTISCNYSTNALVLTATCSISGSGCTSATMYWGDDASGNTNTNLTCSGGTFSHTYVAGTYTPIATVNSASGSNTYSQTVSVSGTGGGTSSSYQYLTTINNTPDDITPFIATYGGFSYDNLFAVRYTGGNPSGGCIYDHTTDGGGSAYCTSLTNMPFSFQYPESIASCTANDRILILDTLLGRVVVVKRSTLIYQTYYAITANQGSRMVCNNTTGDFYIADSAANSLRKYNSSGSLQWNKTTTLGLSQPKDVALSSDGYIYVADAGNYRALKVNSDGTLNTSWGTNGTSDSQFSNMKSITVDGDGKVFILDAYRVKIFTSSGSLSGAFGSQGSVNTDQFTDQVAVEEKGSGKSSRVYVADKSRGIRKFQPLP